MDTSEQRLIIIGAGPKAVALAAKRHVLKQLHYKVPNLIVVEKDEIAANWCGKFGFTDGHQHLGTPPHKDVGFPYDSSECFAGADPNVNSLMFGYSWHQYLINRGEYARWVDRGRPAPRHSDWADYLKWVAALVDLTPEIASVDSLTKVGEKWQVQCRRSNGVVQNYEADGVVITGPGSRTAAPVAASAAEKVMDGATFWTAVESFREFKGIVAVVGAGETSASIAVALAQTIDRSAYINIYTPKAAIYSRGESFFENRRYTYPGDWKSLAAQHRDDFIDRTDRGVFSVHANSVLDRAENWEPMVGRLLKWELLENGVVLHLEYEGHKWTAHVDRVILPTGFDPFWFRTILKGKAFAKLRSQLNSKTGKKKILEAIQDDLSIADIVPKLHVPMLANLAQGPGFPNLSALGLLSDRILRPYTLPPVPKQRSLKPAWQE